MALPHNEGSTQNGDPSAALHFVQRLAEDLEGTSLVLPAFPDAVTRVQLALQSETASTEDIVLILSSEPGLAARILQVANAWVIRRSGPKITDLAQAVNRMGQDMVRSIAIAFGMRRFQGDTNYSTTARKELKNTVSDAVHVAATAYVIAKHYTKLNSDDALLAGLLHVMGRLYIIKRASELTQISDEEQRQVYADWNAPIGRAIADSWALPEDMGVAIEQQDDDSVSDTGPVTLSHVLIGAKLLATGEALEKFVEAEDPLPPVFGKLGIGSGKDDLESFLSAHGDEIDNMRSSLRA